MKLPSQLTYTSDAEPGFTRKGAGKGFAYYDPDGKLVKDDDLKEKFASMAIPPAYKDVWYCANPAGHLQATGVDERGRKQYRYHEEWTKWRDQAKFDSLLPFSEVLPRIRSRVQRELAGEGLDKDRVLAAVVRLLDKTAARIGNETYFEQNGTSGLTTLRCRHVETDGDRLQLEFTAKGGEDREFDLYQPTLSDIVEKLEDLPGQRLFQYESGGAWSPVESSDVNAWLKDVSGEDISAKDFRTWHASRLTLNFLLDCEEAETAKERKSQEMDALRATSEELGHRPPVCRKHYVHPAILEKHEQGVLQVGEVRKRDGLNAEEERLVAFLEGLG